MDCINTQLRLPGLIFQTNASHKKDKTNSLLYRDDVKTGYKGELIVNALLTIWDYDVSIPEPGLRYDLIVEIPELGFKKIQVKTRNDKEKERSISYSFTRGYHASQTGVYAYEKNDFDISAIVLLPFRKVLFRAGVHKNISAKRKEFFMKNGEYLSWKETRNRLQRRVQ